MTNQPAQLPESYRRALSLRRAGTDDASIAAALGVAVESVASILDVADAKLARISQHQTANGEGGERNDA